MPAWPKRYDFGARGLAFNPARNSLFICGFNADFHQVAEIAIPPVTPTAASVSALPFATELQPLTDPTYGGWQLVGKPGDNIHYGGLLVDGTVLRFTAFVYYDAQHEQTLSHFARPLDLSVTGQVTPTAVSGAPCGFLSGYLAHVPPALQSAFGASLVTGQCGIPIVGRTSQGPCAYAFDPAPMTAKPLLAYPAPNGLDGGYGAQGVHLMYNATMMLGGVVFPRGSSSALFFGRIGTGVYGYGKGTADKTLDGQPVPGSPGIHYCYDPQDTNEGEHAWPYRSQVWSVPLSTLADVAAGRVQPWVPIPAIFPLVLPFQHVDNPKIQGVCDDPATGRIFVASAQSDGDAAVVHVLQVKV